MGQKGFWDEQERRQKFNPKKPMLKWRNEIGIILDMTSWGNLEQWLADNV